MEIHPIGIIHSPFKTKDECPIQPIYSSEAEGMVEVFEDYAAGFKDIETFPTFISFTPLTGLVTLNW